MTTNSAPLLIVGTGAMACFFAARLAALGMTITMLGSWPEGIRALREHGVRLVEPDGTEKAYPVQATCDPNNCLGARYALVLVKSWQTGRVAQQLEHCLHPEGLALTLQNGLSNQETLVNSLGWSRVAIGITTTGALLLEPGKVRPVGDEMVSLGIHARLKPLADLLRAAGFITETVADASSLLWGKVVINAAINPLTALLRVPNGELLTRPSARAMMAMAAREAATVAVACGVRLPYPDPVVAVENVARRTAANSSSMLRDVLRQGPTEIDAITGVIVLSGDKHLIPTPINRTLWQLVKALEE